MKYSQYVEFEKLLIENNLTIDDVKENHEVLNEIGTAGLVGAIFAGGLGLLFRKQLLSWGIKSAYLKRLSTFSSRFEDEIMKQVSKMAKKSAKYRQNLLAKAKSLRNDDSEEAAEEKKALEVHKQNYERRLTKEINNFIDKIAEHKSKEVFTKIDGLPSTTEGHKLALKGFWEMKIVDTKLAAFRQLSDDGIISDPNMLDSLKQEAEDLKAEAKEKLKKTRSVIKKEEGGEGEEGEEEKSAPEKVEANIEEVYNEKDKMKEEDLLRKIRLIVSDMKKVGDPEEENRLFTLLKNRFGLEKIKAAQNVSTKPKPDTEQTVIDPEDNL